MSAWLFDSLLVTSLMMAVILVIRRPVAKAFGPGIAYMLWLLPALRLLIPSISGGAPAPVESTQPVREAVRDAVMANIVSPEPVVSAAGEIVQGGADWTALAITLWLGGAAVMFIIQMIRYASMRDELLSEAEDLGRIDGIRLVASDRVGGPLAFGLFRRYIAVPENFVRAYPPAERELAIAHELAHHKSGDLFANLAAFIFLCLQWFNPLAWASWSAFRFDQEAACDARVLAGKDKAARQAYGRALARTAFDGVPTFATALNSPKTILERLRRLTMKDASKQRQSLGKIGLVAAAAVILPLSATFVPAVLKAEEKTEAVTDTHSEKHVKIIKIKKSGDGPDVMIEDVDGQHVKKIERDGKTFVFHTDKELDDAEVEKMIAEAEKSRAEAEKMAGDAERKVQHIMMVRADAEKGRADAERRVIIMNGDHKDFPMDGKRIAAFIPDIDIKEFPGKCDAPGTPITTDVQGFDGESKSRVKIVMCGKGQAKFARIEAIKGLKEARDDIKDDADMPEKVRKEVLEKLDTQIKRMEKQTEND